MSSTLSDRARRRGTNAQMDVETLIEKAEWPRKYLRKGQTMQFLAAMYSLIEDQPDLSRDGIVLDQIVKEIRKNKRWFNPHIKRTGIGDKHSCNSGRGYKVKGRTVMNLPKKEQEEAITNILKSNVINTTDYSKKDVVLRKGGNTTQRKARVTDNSVFVKKWCDEAYYEMTGGASSGGRFRFSRGLARKLEGSW
jgi:hypothetical protein